MELMNPNLPVDGNVRFLENHCTYEWNIPNHCLLSPRSFEFPHDLQCRLSEVQTFRNVKWRFALIFSSDRLDVEIRIIFIEELDRRAIIEDFVVYFLNKERSILLRSTRLEMRYRANWGWCWFTRRNDLLRHAFRHDVIIAWSIKRDPTGIKNLGDDIKQLFYSEDTGTNFTFNVRGKELRIHKEIIGARSDMHNGLFCSQMRETSENEVCVPDCDPVIFEALLLYLYSEIVELSTASELVELWEKAQMYCLPGLQRECVKVMMQQMSVDNYCELAEFAFEQDVFLLIEALKYFYVEQEATILGTRAWRRFRRGHRAVAEKLKSEIDNVNLLRLSIE